MKGKIIIMEISNFQETWEADSINISLSLFMIKIKAMAIFPWHMSNLLMGQKCFFCLIQKIFKY